jgi:xanthine dehydrogenase accessory factor
VNRWLDTLAGVLAHGQRAVLVTVAACQGSTPREPGARMIVVSDTFFGTIGGGQLEWRAIAHARDLLDADRHKPELVRYPLGARLGQCCGGVVHLSFEPLACDALPWVRQALQLAISGLPWGRVVGLASDLEPCRVFGPKPEDALDDGALISQARELLSGHGERSRLLSGQGVACMLIDVSTPPSLQVMLFGAGHVGTALAEILRRQPLRLRWIDSREEADALPQRERKGLIESDDPVAEVECASPGTAFLVMTQSHALDFDLVRAILQREDFRYCGLIGSTSKRAGFIARLRERGFDNTLLDRLRCPIGIEGISGKEPEVIAVAVAAEILALRTPASVAASARAAALPRDAIQV